MKPKFYINDVTAPYVIKTVIQTSWLIQIVGKEKFLEDSYKVAIEKCKEYFEIDENTEKEFRQLIRRTVDYLETGKCTCPTCIYEHAKSVTPEENVINN